MSPQTTKSATATYRPIPDKECDPDISTPAQAFTSATPQPHPVDRSSGDGDEGYPGIVVPSEAPSTIPALHSLRDSDAQDSRTSVSIAPAIVNHQISKATNEHYHGNPAQTDSEIPLGAPEHSCLGHGDGSLQSADAGHGVDSIPKGTSTITKEPHSVSCGDRVVQPEGAPSTSFFQGSSNVQITGSPNFYDVRGNATIIRFDDSQFTDVQRNLICDYIANLTVLPDINKNLKKHVLTQSIISLPRAKAMFDDYKNKKKNGPCFKGTREALLREMADWATNSSESRMYILSGLAGIGKSTVAYTIASRAADLHLLGASFFFSRDETDRKNAEFFFSTLAYQLCAYNETFANAIGDVLLTERGSMATTKDPHDQLHALILEPLRNIVQSHSRPILIVVDALDECDEEEAFSVLTGLSQLVRDLPSFKIILTTRPQLRVNDFLVNLDGHKIFRLQDIEEKIVDGDIKLYLNYSLSLEQIQKRYPKRQWCASDEEIESLVRVVGRLFIIASTAVRYILDKSASDPAGQMQKLLLASSQDRTPFKDLSHFYTVILRNVVSENCDNEDTVKRYQSVVGTIICVQCPLPVSALAHLINVNIVEIHEVLDNLQPVISLGSDDVPRIYHKSLPDYLMDQARCRDSRLQIATRIHHTKIAICCFEIMDQHLKRNILHLSDPAQFMNNEDGLKEDGITDEQMQEKIPQQLRYACVYWANHLEVANPEDKALKNGLERFAYEHLLYWLEVLSLIGKVDLAHRAIGVVLKLLTSTSSDLHQLLSDALRFISKFYEIIKRSALHTYHSAIPFTPTNSLLYRRYIKEAEHSICSIEGEPEKWDALVANLRHEQRVQGIKFSLDSTLLVSCSEEGLYNYKLLKIWDAVTGTPISTILGHKFAVANDFSTFASSQDNIATLYNVNGGTPIGNMFTTSSKIEKLALSYESSRVAAGLSDGTVWLWDSGSAELIDKFDRFQGEYRSLFEFSRTGARLAYSSWDDIKLRDGISGRFIANLHPGSPYEFQFSGDGSRIATLSRNLRLWNSQSGVQIAGPVSSDDQGGLAISINGSLLATIDQDKVNLWGESHNLSGLAKIEVLECRATSMAFSLDNILAIITASDTKLYNVNTHSFIHTLSFGGRYIPPAFSPDCTRLAIEDYKGNVNLWDIRDIDASGPPSKGNATAVTALTLSRDCSRLAFGFEDGRVELWGISRTNLIKQRIGPLALPSKVEELFIRIFGQSCDSCRHPESVRALEFDHHGRLFASGSDDGTIKLWNEDGVLHGTLKVPGMMRAVALSNSVLVVATDELKSGYSGVTLWSLDTLSPIHTIDSFERYRGLTNVSIAENSTLIATCLWFGHVTLFDVVNRTTISTFDVLFKIRTMTFLPDNSQLVVQSPDGVFQSFNLTNHHTTEAPELEHLVQLPNIPLWYGVPVWHCEDKEQHYVAALFSQHKSPVPVVWIPKRIPVIAWTQGSSMIALSCEDGRIIFLRLPTRHVS